jgi:hypothetical protein
MVWEKFLSYTGSHERPAPYHVVVAPLAVAHPQGQKSAKLSSNNNRLGGCHSLVGGAPFERNERKAKSPSVTLEVLDHALPILLVIRVLTDVDLWHPMAQPARDDPGQLMGRRCHGPRRSQASPHTAIIGS